MTDRVVPDVAPERRIGLTERIIAAWPPGAASTKAGYAATDLMRWHLIDAKDVPVHGPRQGAVGVVANDVGQVAALPLTEGQRDGAWHVSTAGDGLGQALLEWLSQAPAVAGEQMMGFDLQRFDEIELDVGERAIGADQTNTSVVIGDRAIIKWRTSFLSSGTRGLTIRQHLREHGFPDVPRLLGALTWHGPDGRTTVLADIDAYLDGARDGWDYFSERLRVAGPVTGAAFAPTLGTLTAALHLALRTPSYVLPSPVEQCGPETIRSWHAEAIGRLERTLASDAPDAQVVRDRQAQMRAQIDLLDGPGETLLQPIHADLHLGQLVAWSGGLAFIDFDGPPEATPADGLRLDPSARDVAQMLSSLDHLGAVVCQRDPAWSDDRARRWARSAKRDFLAAYRAAIITAGAPEVLDERLLAPFVVEQLCRELIYADEVLPRWRYAPVAALRWLFPQTDR